jgi:two-component system LytT family response regulator
MRQMMIAPAPEGIRILVVDDEGPARQRLTDLLRQDCHVKSIIEAGDGQAAVRMIHSERPDLVFLDVQMPELSGIGVIEKIGAMSMPLTIFVTAYDQHAIRAFESNALDYLLKPFSDERLEATMARARARLGELKLREFGDGILQMISSQAPSRRYLDRLAIKSDGTIRFVRIADVDWIESAGVYVNLHVAGKELLYRASLSELTENLDPRQFVRVHRSAIVNVDSIVRLESLSHGEFEVVLRDGARSRVSRTYRSTLENRLGQSL